MLSRLFKRKPEVKTKSYLGKQAELIHDVTVFQTGVAIIDGDRVAIRTIDGSELCKGTLVEVVKEENSYIYVKKV